MPTTSRVNNALPRNTSEEGLAFKQLTGIEKTALVGNGQGAVYVPSPSGTTGYGKVWIRLFEGVGANGETLTSPPKRAFAVGTFYPAENMVVKVRESAVTGLYEVTGNDVLGAAQRGVNANSLNPQNPSNNQIWLRQIRNMQAFIPTTNAASSTKISIEPYLYIYDGVVKDATKGQSDNLDLSSYIPSAGNERLVGEGTKPSTNTVQYSAGTIRTISSSAWSLADIQEIVDGFDDDIIGIQIYHLKDAQTSISETDKRFDLRQFINLPNQPAKAGSSNIIAKNNTIASGHDAHFAGGLTVTGGLTINGGVSVYP